MWLGLSARPRGCGRRRGAAEGLIRCPRPGFAEGADAPCAAGTHAHSTGSVAVPEGRARPTRPRAAVRPVSAASCARPRGGRTSDPAGERGVLVRWGLPCAGLCRGCRLSYSVTARKWEEVGEKPRGRWEVKPILRRNALSCLRSKQININAPFFRGNFVNSDMKAVKGI